VQNFGTVSIDLQRPYSRFVSWRTILRLLVAAVVGSCLSTLLLWLTYTTHSEVLFWPQAAGFLLCWLTRGIHNATRAEYWAITMPANAALYGAVVFVMSGILRKRRGLKITK
jgi:hypothetical protein